MNPESTGENRNPDGTFKEGVSGNPLGRPPGSISVIARIKKIFEEDPEDFENFVKSYKQNADNQKHLVEMIDGKPRQRIGVEGGEEGSAFVTIVKYADGDNSTPQIPTT